MGNKHSTSDMCNNDQKKHTMDVKYGEDSVKNVNKKKQSINKLHKSSDHLFDTEPNNRRKNSISYSSESDHEGFLDTQYLGICHL